MCGIAGIIGKNASKDILDSLLAPIIHRGEEKYRYESIISDWGALGTHRLAIVDESSGKQPFVDDERKIFCIFNGEIYNHHHLRESLSAYYKFKSECDTEVILKAYIHWGNEFVNYLDGQFGIAIYDTTQDTFILARDRMGIKGLYYANFENSLVFSSELKSLTHLKAVAQVQELKPGTIWKNGKTHIYFTLQQFNSASVKPKDYKFRAKNLLINAVAKRIPNESDKVACLLSGGLDSSLITYIASKIRPTTAYTITHSGSESPDLIAAKELCAKFNIKHVIISPHIEEMQKFYLHEGVYMTESFEPILVRNAVTYHFLCCKLVEDGFKYCLNGEGADELFGGYDFVQEALEDDRDKVIWHSLSIISKTYLQMSDRASMYATLEARVPYMDKDFVNFCLKLPSEVRLNNNQNKVLLRDLFANELPKSIINQRKVGMNEGAGYGVNSSENSIYYQAVKSHYNEFPEKLNKDIETCNIYSNIYQVNLMDIEEVYNFAKFCNHNYHKLQDNNLRLQLNGKLISKI